MKKTIVLLTIVLAIVAAPVFAEVTASGDVDFRFAYTGDEYGEGNDNDLKVTYGATLSDFTSIDVAAEASNETTEGKAGLELNEMTLTQDITGALGIDSSVGVAVTFGVSSFEPKEYQGVAGFGDLEYGDDSFVASLPDEPAATATAEEIAQYTADLLAAVSDANANLLTYHILDPGTIMTKVSLSIMDMLTVDTAIYEPSGKDLKVGETFSDGMQYGMNAYGTFGIVDASFSYLKYGKDLSGIGFNGAASPMEGLKLGAGMNMFLTKDENYGQYGVSAAYTLNALTAGIAMVSKSIDSENKPDFQDVTSLAVNVNYQVTEAAKVFTGVKMVDLTGDEDLAYEFGGSYVLDGVTYSAGYADDTDYVNKLTGINEDGHVFFRVEASF